MLEPTRAPRKAAIAAELRGELKGYRNALLRQARMRFGEAIGEAAAALLESVTDMRELDDLNDWMTTCESGDALLARLRHA